MKDFFSTLRTEAGKWQRDKVITAAQKKQILDRYGKKIQQYEKVEATGKINSVISVIGAILLGVGVLLLVAANWQSIPNVLRVLILLTSTGAAALIGNHLYAGRADYPKTGFALIILSNLMMGATIFLIAQIYHVNANASSLLMLWLLSVIPMSYLYRSGLLASLVAILFAVWMPLFLSEQPITDKTVNFFALYFGYGALYISLGAFFAKEAFRSFALALKTWGVVIVMFIFYLFTFHDLVEDIQEPVESLTHLPLAAISIPAFAIAIACIVRGEQMSFREGIAAVVVAVFAWIAQLTNPDPVFTALIMNLFMLGGEIFLISVGYRFKQPALVYLGLGFFTLQVFTRYIDWFFELLPRSIFFIVGGILFIAVGIFLEKQRKRVMATL